MLVRMAVLKGKDPQQILEEMEIIDKQGTMLLSLNQCVEYFGLLWSPYVIGRPYIFSCCGLFLLLFFFLA